MPAAGSVVRTLWTIFNQSAAPLTGMTSPADITFTLHRTTSTGIVASSETITMTEIGVTGNYAISFTPDFSGLYTLQLKELNANTNGIQYRFPIEVFAAGAAFLPAFANAFCALTDVERWLQQTIDVTTNPDENQTAAFAESRAAILMSLCASLGFAVTPSTVTAGSRLQTILRDANAIGAALDYTVAQILSIQPSKSDRFELFRQLWLDYVGGRTALGIIAGTIETEIASLVALGTDHILSGDTLAATESSPPTDIGIGLVTMGTVY